MGPASLRSVRRRGTPGINSHIAIPDRRRSAPDSVVFAIAVTLVYGFEEGMAWAFVGGLCLDFFALRPLGSSVFELLGVVALATLAEPVLSRSRYPGCVIATFVLTPVFLVISDATTGLLRPRPRPIPCKSRRGGVANAIVAAIAAPLVIALKRRRSIENVSSGGGDR